ncbi:major facilitator superfamily transporter [Colletotrichum lupini]|uniref:Major facilitator superfamily transporter n=1 Tax=Colletotrichum lupini TaxID=145971 RepID=A0A9Q8SLL9_9PEZI|nr:major facilitator superfamily transporter [Colletotrichum lupini]UQC79425.1 major facilitator superfamily transporter [Colletotrichum lupini]
MSDDKNDGLLVPIDFNNVSGGRRESRIDKYAKRSSQMFIPFSIVDFRHSQALTPASPRYPMQTLQEGGRGLERIDSIDTITAEKQEAAVHEEEVLGSTEIYDKDGNIRLVPTPTPDPKDPLNLPEWRKWLAVASLCFFGSVSLAAEIAVAGLLPVFILEYSGVDPAPTLKHADLKGNPNPLAIVPSGVTPVSLTSVSLLATIPMLSNGVATYLLVPLTAAIGRRPVLILTSAFSWGGGFWAGYSKSLTSHIAARVFHGLGSGAVEALLPLIVQDMMFLHKRNKAVASIIASQGPMIMLFGILGPYIAVNWDWRWIYWITSAVGVLTWIMLILFVPETLRQRSKAELAGHQLWPIAAGEDRTQLDYATYGARTRWDDLGFFQSGTHWKDAGLQIIATLKTTMFPAVLWCTLLQVAFGMVMGATGQATSFALLAAGVPFELTGLSQIPQILSTIVIFVVGGPVADSVSLWISKKKGGREAEHQLPNLILPIFFAITGALVFGYADQNHLHYAVLLLGTFFLMTSTLITAPIVQNYVIESYPQWAGPVLVNVSTLRVFISFPLNTQVTTWLQELGPMKFTVYLSIILLVVSTGIPILFIFGKKLRMKTSDKTAARPIA